MKKILCLLAVLAGNSQSAVVPYQSRIIFHPGEIRSPLLLINNSNAPVLVQSWVDTGTPDNKPGEKVFPFVALPAVFSLSKDEKKEINIMQTELAATLPTDRESLYWLNIYEINSVKKNTTLFEQNKISLALNTQLKVINRPFKDVDNFQQRTKKIIFETQQAEGKVSITVVNNTPYYFTPGTMSITAGQKNYPVFLDAEKTTSPFSKKTFFLESPISQLPDNKAILNFTAIDDSGALASFSYPL